GAETPWRHTMPRIGDIQRKDYTKRVEIDFGDGEELTIVCYPHRLTRARQEELEELDEDDHEGFARLFFEIMESWDLLDDDEGKPLPFNADTISLLSTPTMLQIMDGIVEAVRPKQRKRRR